MFLSNQKFIERYIKKELQLNIKSIKRDIDFYKSKKGIAYDENEFSKQVLKLVTLIQYGEKYIAYNLEEGIYDILKPQDLGIFIKFIMDSLDEEMWTQRREDDCIQRLTRSIGRLESIPTNEKLIFFNNGIYNLETRKQEHFSSDVITMKKLSANYSPQATCPNFLRFLDEICNGDKKLIKLIQEIVGYCFISNNKAQKFFVFYGNGSNGKSVLQSIITHVLGNKNVSNLSIAQIGQRFSNACIVDKNANIATENEADFETEQLKAITSGDSIMVEEKYSNAQPYVPTCKMIFFCNTLPNTKDNSYGFYRRLLLIPLTKTITNPNPNLSEELKKEADGIATWALEGLERLIKNNYQFTLGQAVIDMQNKYKKEQDPVKSFFEEQLNYCAESRIAKRNLLDAYRGWLQENSIASKGTDSTQKFWKELKRVIEMTGKTDEYVEIRGYMHLKHYEFK